MKWVVVAAAVVIAGGVGMGGSARAASAPRPVVVYVGHQVVGSGLSVAGAVAKAKSQVSFGIETPRSVPAGYVAMQLAVTPRQSGVGGGFTTLSYGRGGAGFAVQQAARPIAHVGGTASAVTVGGRTATLREFKIGGQDLLILSGTTATGSGYDVTTDATRSRLTAGALEKIAASLS